METECSVRCYAEVRVEALDVVSRCEDQCPDVVRSYKKSLLKDHRLFNMKYPENELRAMNEITRGLPEPQRRHRKIKVWEEVCRAITSEAVRLHVYGCHLLCEFHKRKKSGDTSSGSWWTRLMVCHSQLYQSGLAFNAMQVESAAASLMETLDGGTGIRGSSTAAQRRYRPPQPCRKCAKAKVYVKATRSEHRLLECKECLHSWHESK